MNFREKFELWHEARYGYVTKPIQPFTAYNCEYHGIQQARWEGWQACSDQQWADGYAAGLEKGKSE